MQATGIAETESCQMQIGIQGLHTGRITTGTHGAVQCALRKQRHSRRQQGRQAFALRIAQLSQNLPAAFTRLTVHLPRFAAGGDQRQLPTLTDKVIRKIQFCIRERIQPAIAARHLRGRQRESATAHMNIAKLALLQLQICNLQISRTVRRKNQFDATRAKGRRVNIGNAQREISTARRRGQQQHTEQTAAQYFFTIANPD